jgi:hypothetical protein
LSNLNYDQNGNITNLRRKGNVGANFGDIDNLTYYYNGNRLTGITDATSNTDGFKEATSGGTGAYTYWPDGSLKSDANKGISQIDYDTFLQRVSQVTFSNGSWIKWSYDGAGTLLKRQLSNGDVWDYADDALYKNGVLYQFNDEEGRITLNNGTYNYEFEYRDHQNNLRVGFKAENGQLVQAQTSETDAFGFEISSLSSTGAGLQNYRFQKQEKIDDFGLNISWFKYRPADPTIGRMWQVDRLAEEYRHNSVYAFSENKVTRHVELDGLEAVDFWTGVGQALSDDMIGGTPVRANPQHVDAYNSGRTAGHLLGAMIGAGETLGGFLGLAGSVVGEVGTAGAATPIAVPAAVSSTALMTHGVMTTSNALDNLRNDKGRVEASGNGDGNSGRGKNHLEPDKTAQGDHSTFRTDPKTGKTTNTATYEKNPRNPSGFQETKRVDVTGKPHIHSKTKEPIPTPHVIEPKQKNPRPARPDELPRQ